MRTCSDRNNLDHLTGLVYNSKQDNLECLKAINQVIQANKKSSYILKSQYTLFMHLWSILLLFQSIEIVNLVEF